MKKMTVSFLKNTPEGSNGKKQKNYIFPQDVSGSGISRLKFLHLILRVYFLCRHFYNN